MELKHSHLIYDWNQQGAAFRPAGRVLLNDESLRDGLQSPSVRDPSMEEKIKILHLMEALGINYLDLGLPGAGPRACEHVERLAQEISRSRMKIRGNCAARTHQNDIRPIAEIQQKTGVRIEAATFIGSSPIRRYTEDWTDDFLLRTTEDAVKYARSLGLDVMYVTEDTVRSQPDDLRLLLTAAVHAGAKRVCLCDTVGAAVPQGVRNLVAWVKQLLAERGVADRVGIDWHGHRDRGLDVANTLAALEAGATRVHGTALGVGERVGNTPIEQLLVNLKLLGWRDDDLTTLPEYCAAVSRAVGVPVPANWPIVGRDAFRTATGVHAAAVITAQRKGAAWLADRVYSGVPASWVGRAQEIEVGHMSGGSNVLHYLRSHGLPTDQAVVDAVMALAKRSERLLTEQEVVETVQAATRR